MNTALLLCDSVEVNWFIFWNYTAIHFGVPNREKTHGALQQQGRFHFKTSLLFLFYFNWRIGAFVSERSHLSVVNKRSAASSSSVIEDLSIFLMVQDVLASVGKWKVSCFCASLLQNMKKHQTCLLMVVKRHFKIIVEINSLKGNYVHLRVKENGLISGMWHIMNWTTEEHLRGIFPLKLRPPAAAE